LHSGIEYSGRSELLEDCGPMMGDRRAAAHGPILNVPASALALIASLFAIHLVRGFLDPERDTRLVLTFAFIPARYAPPPELAGQAIPGGAGADVWSFVTHMFLHADWMHLALNSLGLLVFGGVVARRLGPVRFLLFSFVSAAAGALANLALYWGVLSVLVGASGAISGHMAGAVRLMYAEGGSLATIHRRRLEDAQPLTLAQTFTNPRALIFLLIWFLITLSAGIGGFGPPGETGRIAWEAHLGGFAGGLLLFGWLDPGRSARG
jgi:membrane associated rhomboid family serine protease